MSPAWTGRPRLALTVRALVLAVPVAGALLAARLASAAPGPYLVRLAAVVGAAALAFVVLERAGRRLLPLPALLRLALVFPDEAPNRFRLALRAGSTRDLMTAVRRPGGSGAQDAALQTVELLGALARHDPATRRHSERVRAYTDLLAEALGLPEDDRAKLRWTSLLHDLGKVTLAPAVLGKPAALDDDEWHQMRQHPTAGAELARDLEGFLGPWFATIEQHHERWDGTGYPAGLSGTQICLGARIVAVADSFEVMTAGRSYRGPVDAGRAREELVRCGGTQFDPDVVRALLDLSLGRLPRWTRSMALAAAVPFAGLPDVGLGAGSALHPVAKAHAAAVPTGHDASGAIHHTGHTHVGGPVPDDR